MKKLGILMLIVFLFGGCATIGLDLREDPEIPYYAALRFFNGAWESYHKVWIQLPEETKTEWANKYHTKFDTASDFLAIWALSPGEEKEDWKKLKETLENMLIQLAIKQ